MKRNKKGFTIVELVIVIAVIAILSAILIPTFVNLTDKANDARAKQEVADAYTMFVMDASDNYGGDLTEIKADKVSAYSNESTYVVGAVVKKDSKYYGCKTAIGTSEEWDSTKWEELTSLVKMPPMDSSVFCIVRESVQYVVDSENGGWKVVSADFGGTAIKALKISGTELEPVYSVGNASYNNCEVLYK